MKPPFQKCYLEYKGIEVVNSVPFASQMSFLNDLKYFLLSRQFLESVYYIIGLKSAVKGIIHPSFLAERRVGSVAQDSNGIEYAWYRCESI